MKVLKQLSPSELQHVLSPITKTMAIISPFYVIVFPFVILCTIPVAIFASITSVLAFSVLAFRVVLIYFELLVAVVPYYILGATDPPGEPLPRTKSFIDPVVRVRRRKRRSSSSNVSTGTITPGSGEQTYGLSQSIGPTRDFEGVGGWRLDNSPSDDDVLWTNINSRLELPADHIRRHQRSQTSGAVPLRGQRSSSPEAVATSPNTSRARTPPTTGPTAMTASNGYFSQGPVSPRTLKKMPSLATSVSGSSESSKGSSGLSMKRL